MAFRHFGLGLALVPAAAIAEISEPPDRDRAGTVFDIIRAGDPTTYLWLESWGQAP